MRECYINQIDGNGPKSVVKFGYENGTSTSECVKKRSGT